MPERKRKKREAERDKLQRLMENLPEHVKQRMENPSSQSLMLSEALKSRLYNGGIYSISSEGDVERITQDPDLGANANRQETRIKRAELPMRI